MSLCSDKLSFLLSKTDKEDLMSFKWDELLQEATQYAPCLVKILTVAFQVISSANWPYYIPSLHLQMKDYEQSIEDNINCIVCWALLQTGTIYISNVL